MRFAELAHAAHRELAPRRAEDEPRRLDAKDMSRDATLRLEEDYAPFDLVPGTGQVETVVVLRRA